MTAFDFAHWEQIFTSYILQTFSNLVTETIDFMLRKIFTLLILDYLVFASLGILP